ncbi:MAG: dihydrodipicolinate synthase family protein, partial [Oscillospiraceae bacterium]|nr:dihydrodipicolinate synthase family protein [Oscillospiraceae bacterium]
ANHLKYLPLMNDLFMEVNPIPVKAALNLMGLHAGPMRLPLCEMTPEHTAAMADRLKEAGLL